MSRAAERARACFAVAKSTTHEGERAAAINRGMALLERAGLNPDHFDIPGRAKAGARYVGSISIGEYYRAWRVAEEVHAAGMPGFTFDDLVREAVAESMRRRARRQNGVD